MSEEELSLNFKLNNGNIVGETVRVLLKIADNILQDPSNLKVRQLPKNNISVRKKILDVKGGRECLKLMGFEEMESIFQLPTSAPLSKVNKVKSLLLDWQKTASSKPSTSTSLINNVDEKMLPLDVMNEKTNDLDDVKPFCFPPFKSMFENRFLKRVEQSFHVALAFGDSEGQKRARALIPLAELQRKAQAKLRSFQEKIKKDKLPDPELSLDDFLLKELLFWFKDDFFVWVSDPPCQTCGKPTTFHSTITDPPKESMAGKIEQFKCSTCPVMTRFPRYRDLQILLETRKGRCGEWAQVFTFLCRSLGWDARFVIDELLDHVWTEVYSPSQRRWVHCDPCENAHDTPLMYETGWKKQLSYIIAYSPEEVQDVTWRYTSCHKEVLRRRKECGESELVDAIMKLREDRQKDFSRHRKNYLARRVLDELVEMMVERKPKSNEHQGRISGSKQWRNQRSEGGLETNNQNMYIWQIEDRHINNVDNFTLKYSTASDSYEFLCGANSKSIEDWESGVLTFQNVIRKEEEDWKMVYLCRDQTEENCDGGITWKIDISKTGKVIDKVYVKLDNKTFEDGRVDITISSNNKSMKLEKDQNVLQSDEFSDGNFLTVPEDGLSLKKGRNNCCH